MTVTPLAMPNRPVAPVLPVRLAWTTSTGDKPLSAAPAVRLCPTCEWDGHEWCCPGSYGLISSGSCRAIFGERCFCW